MTDKSIDIAAESLRLAHLSDEQWRLFILRLGGKTAKQLLSVMEESREFIVGQRVDHE